MRRWAVLGLIVFASAAVLSPSATAGDRQLADSFHQCGNVIPATAWDIEAKRVACPRAREVVRIYVRQGAGDGDDARNVGAFHCRLRGTYIDGGLYRCTAKGQRVIKFARGG